MTAVGRPQTVVDVVEPVGDGIAAAARPALKCSFTRNCTGGLRTGIVHVVLSGGCDFQKLTSSDLDTLLCLVSAHNKSGRGSNSLLVL